MGLNTCFSLQGLGGFLSGKKKTQETTKTLKTRSASLAEKASKLVNQAFLEFTTARLIHRKAS